MYARMLIVQCVTGKLPFAKLGDALQVIVHEICTKAPPDICAASDRRASPELRKVVEDALQKHPHRRLASAEIMLARIREVELLSAGRELKLPLQAAAGDKLDELSMGRREKGSDTREEGHEL